MRARYGAARGACKRSTRIRARERLAMDPEILEAMAHRTAGLERAIVRCDAPPPPAPAG